MDIKIRLDDWWEKLGLVDSEDLSCGIIKQYQDNAMPYHNIDHIIDGYKEIDKAKGVGVVCDYKAIEFAWAFHDIVYDPKKDDNEIESAKHLLQVSQHGSLNIALTHKCIDLVIATKHDLMFEDIDRRMICDVDLAIFGQGISKVLAYDENIRKEYIHYDDSVFFPGRAKVLKSFLERKNNTGENRIYQTDFFKGLYEEDARENLQVLIDKYGG